MRTLRILLPGLALALLVVAAMVALLLCPPALPGVPVSMAMADAPTGTLTLPVPHAPTLGDATSPPRMLVMVPAHDAWQVLRQCDGKRMGFYTNVQAYTWSGGGLVQRWTRDKTLTYWRIGHGRVTFDGLTWHNESRRPVLVAGWCD